MEKDTKYSSENVVAADQSRGDESVGEVKDHAMQRGLRPRHL